MDQEDPRLFERFMARLPVKFKDTRDEFGANVFLRDVSAAGARIVTRERPLINDNLALLVLLPHGLELFPLNGQVVWSKSDNTRLWDAGIRFHRLSLMSLQRLFKFCIVE